MTCGIGKSLVPWMLQNGASNIVLSGRSACSSLEMPEFVRHYNSSPGGIHVRVVTCEVSSRESISSAIASISDLPTIKEIIHGAMHLRESLFLNATFQDWQDINRPKVDAAWNLHHLVPDLDFFVAFEPGVNVVGNIG
ncbi:hypothetical protein ACHAPO_011399 [Fusarium lateritium]